MAEDKALVCVDCQNDFVFTAGEQDFFERKGMQQPKRCQPCRKTRKELKAQQESGEAYPSYR